jgi:hypothetical protein
MKEFIKHIKAEKRIYKKAYISTYSKKIKWKIILPKEIYEKLIDSLSNFPPEFNFNEEIGLYFLSLISALPSYFKDRVYPGGYVNLNSTKMKDVNYNYIKYLNYFVERGIIQRNRKYSNSKGNAFSKSYRYNFKEIKKLTMMVFEFDVLKKLYDKIVIKEKNVCNDLDYLTKWFGPNLTIDSDNIFLEIQEKLKFTSAKEKLELKKAENYMRSLKNFHYQEFWVSRNPKSDNRVHTNLGNMPKLFRKGVKYDGMNLAGIDIKNSQPFFLIVLLDSIMNRGKEESNNRVINKIEELGYSGTMLRTLSESLYGIGFQDEYKIIKQDILSGKFYDNLEDKFNFDRSIKGKYMRRFFCKDSKTQPMYFFDSKRDVVKRLVLFFLYKANQSSEKKEDVDYLIFKKLYPNFCIVLEFFKERNSKDLPKLLQHIEADCVIDFTCKRISEKYPNMPLFTIHDSIISTEDNVNILEIEVNKYLKEYCMGILPTLKPEYWCEECRALETA